MFKKLIALLGLLFTIHTALGETKITKRLSFENIHGHKISTETEKGRRYFFDQIRNKKSPTLEGMVKLVQSVEFKIDIKELMIQKISPLPGEFAEYTLELEAKELRSRKGEKVGVAYHFSVCTKRGVKNLKSEQIIWKRDDCFKTSVEESLLRALAEIGELKENEVENFQSELEIAPLVELDNLLGTIKDKLQEQNQKVRSDFNSWSTINNFGNHQIFKMHPSKS